MCVVCSQQEIETIINVCVVCSLQEIETIEVPGYGLEKASDEFYHLTLAQAPPPSLPNTPDILDHTSDTMSTTTAVATEDAVVAVEDCVAPGNVAVFDSLAVRPWFRRSKTPDSTGEGVKGHRRSTSASLFPTSSLSASVTLAAVQEGGRVRRRASMQNVVTDLDNILPRQQSLSE